MREYQLDEDATGDAPVSFLIGAGFSKPAGYPLASEMNDRFVGLQESDITIHSSGTAWFRNGADDPNRHMRRGDREFAERLLRHYCGTLNAPEDFHYELFYDWLAELRTDSTIDGGVVAIAEELGGDLDNSLLNFEFTFNQLVGSLVTRWHTEVHLCAGLPESHARFLELVGELRRHARLHFHSLNHDLFFESLSYTDAMGGDLADGFVENGSKYYGRLQLEDEHTGGKGRFEYTVRLRRFADAFDGPLNLYKLHGSVDQYVFNDADRQTIKAKRGIGPNDLMREVEVGGKLDYLADHFAYHPDFLTGVKYKTTRYSSSPYYEAVFRRFKENLGRSESLIAIGYGFGDSEINRIVVEEFARKVGKRLVVIGVSQPDIPPELTNLCQFLPGGVEGFDLSTAVGVLATEE